MEADTFCQNEKERSFVIKFTDYIKIGRFDLALNVLSSSLELVLSIYDLHECEKAIFITKLEEGLLYFQNSN